MEITGTIKAITEVQEGTSEKGSWAKRTIVVTESGAEHPNELALSMFKNGEHIDYVKDKFTYKVGDLVTVEYNTRANEYKGKWYGDNSIWQIAKVVEGAKNESPKENESSDDLPF